MIILCILVPSAAPASLNVTSVTSVSITILWDLIPCLEQNGRVTHHTVKYRADHTGKVETVSVPGGDTTQTTLSGLSSSTEYWIEVAAENSAGVGEYSSPVLQETKGELT